MKYRILFILLATFWGSKNLNAQTEATSAATPVADSAVFPMGEPLPPAAPAAPLAPVIVKVATPAPGFPFGSSDRGITFNFDSDDEKATGTKGTTVTTVSGFDWQHVVVPIVAIGFTFGTPILLVALVLAYRMKKSRLLHQTIQNLVASGQPIPPELLASSGAKAIPSPQADLRKGIILCMVGLGMIGFFLGVDGPWGLGFIPLAWGGGHLLTARFAPRNNGKSTDALS